MGWGLTIVSEVSVKYSSVGIGRRDKHAIQHHFDARWRRLLPWRVATRQDQQLPNAAARV